MTPLKTQPPFVSTFLSHSSKNSDLVEAVAERLGRRGVLAWLDKNELDMGPLDIALKEAVQQQTTITLFLSKDSLDSEWCEDELRWAIEAGKGCEHLLPVYLDNPLKLVRENTLLKDLFLHPDGDRVNQLGIVYQSNSNTSDPDTIAESIATAVYRRSISARWSEVVIFIDQRGQGPKRGWPEIPENIARLNLPILTFRPSSKTRQDKELLTGADWDEMVNTLKQSLSSALTFRRIDTCKVRVLGNAQVGLMWAVGRHFDRTNNIDLYGYDRYGHPITNKGQERLASLPNGNPDRAQLVNQDGNVFASIQPKVALGVEIGTRLFSVVQKNTTDMPLFWIESGKISDSEQAMQLIADIAAFAERLEQKYQVDELVLFWAAGIHIALLAAANLTTHGIPRIKFMEWDHSNREYVHLPMP